MGFYNYAEYQAMEIFLAVLRYGFVVVVAVEIGMIGRALVTMVLEKAHGAAPPPVKE